MIPVACLAETEIPNLKFIWTLKGPQIRKPNVEKNQVRRPTLPNLGFQELLQSYSNQNSVVLA